ncbi:Ig-like domain-containing protein [bacterium]|nr:Ig-like domain-containing protein [candidate division CSSED10-310 bacterium]
MKRRTSWIQISIVLVLMLCSACFDTTVDDDTKGLPDRQNVGLTTLLTGLNFPVDVEFVDNEDPSGVGECSVLTTGMILVANRGMNGANANSLLAISAGAEGTTTTAMFSNATYRDRFGESGVNAPTGISFRGPFVWTSNVADLVGSIAALDPNPCVAPNGPGGTAGEPVDGPTGTGVFGSDDFGFRVLEVVPYDGDEDVPTNTTIRVRFSQPVNPATVTAATFQVDVDDSDIPGLEDPSGTYLFHEGNTVVEFAYQQYGELGERTVYTINLDSNIKDYAGNELDGNPDSYGSDDFQSSFTTTSYGNPRVVSVSPTDGATDVSLRPKVTVCFSKPMKSLSTTSFKVVKDGTVSTVSGTLIYPEEDGATCYYALFQQDLEEDTVYHVIVTPDARDLAGNPLDQIPGGDLDLFESLFSTGGEMPGEGFCLMSVSPEDGSAGRNVDTDITLIFSAPVNQATISGNITVTSGLGAVTGTFIATGDNSTIVFSPGESYPQCSRITVTIGSGLRSVTGDSFSGWCDNPAGSASSSFDVVCENPYVASNLPVCGLQNANIDTTVTVNFSELMDLSSINAATFYIFENGIKLDESRVEIRKGDSVNGYSWAELRLQDEQGQESLLRAHSHYQYWVTIYARDLDSNNLDQNRDLRDGLTPFSCDFWTGEGTDPYPPCLVSSSPEDGASGISIFSTLTACFDKQMDRNTVNSASFIVSSSDGTVDGELDLSNDLRCIVFTPDPALPENDNITVTLTADLLDIQGRPLDGNCDGISGDPAYIRFTTSSGAVVINEVVDTPVFDWNDDPGTGNGIPFDQFYGSGEPSTDKDEWIELYNGTSQTFDLASSHWTIRMEDTTPADELIGDGDGAVEFYSGGSSAAAFLPNTFLVIGDPEGAMNQDVWIQLFDGNGDLLDDVELGTQDFEADGKANNAPKGSSSGGGDEAVTRCPNGFDSDYDATDFSKTTATIAGSNNSACGSIGGSAEDLPYIATGMGGIVCAGTAPDDYNGMSWLSFAFSLGGESLYVLDFDDGIHTFMTELENVSGLEWVPDPGGTPGHGNLFLTRAEDTITIMHMTPSGTVGSAGTTVTLDPDMVNPTTSLYSTYLNLPVAAAYSRYSNTVFIANRGDGTVAECNLDGEFLHLYDTGLGAYMLSGIDVGDTLGGETVLLTVTGGRGISEFSGPMGSLVAFQPLH